MFIHTNEDQIMSRTFTDNFIRLYKTTEIESKTKATRRELSVSQSVSQSINQ